jgi:diphosphomevalonate decarboxylase
MTIPFHHMTYSNIALIKYWGKKNNQEPLNPSLSCTLAKSMTAMQGCATLTEGDDIRVDHFFFHEKENELFKNKINLKLKKMSATHQWMKGLRLDLNTQNNFPHSSGIASSASSMSALAMALATCYAQKKNETMAEAAVSSLARELSGSACRSVQRGWNLWGKTAQVSASTDQYAVSINDEIHPIFGDIQDTICIVSEGSKSVSSSEGHEHANEHPEINRRVERANDRLKRLLGALKIGDWQEFISVVEAEALDLHTLMMTGKNPFCLLETKSLEVIKKIITLRDRHQLICAYTLDAGPNIHLLYPKSQKEKIQQLVLPELKNDLLRFIDDEFSL